MKKSKVYLVAIAFAAMAMVSGCAKEKTATGNADVRLFMYGPYTLNSTSPSVTIPLADAVTKKLIDSSLVLVYYELNSKWWPGNTVGSQAAFASRWEVEPRTADPNRYDLWLGITNLDGSAITGGSYTLTRVKVIIAPPTGFSGKKEPVDYSDYYATMRYFGLRNI